MAKNDKKVIITAALTGAATMKNNNPSVPYTVEEFAEEAYKCYQSGPPWSTCMHGRTTPADPRDRRIQAVHDAIKARCPELLICLSSAVGIYKTPEQRWPRSWRSSRRWPRTTPTA